ncbi:hypothetical protein SeMB42_g04598 [Synchytrium endobioticum]|nr:hypothetical protein SeMB42_g04598 [Synchytrium endobioticum]
MEVLKNTLQAAPARARPSTLALAAHIYRREGIRGFFRGYVLSLAVFVPYSVIYYVAYEQLKRGCAPAELGFATYAACAGVAGAVAGAASNGLDVVKTRVQVGAGRVRAGDVMRDIYRREGAMGFARGAGHRVAWITPSVVLSMSIYEVLKDSWKHDQEAGKRHE